MEISLLLMISNFDRGLFASFCLFLCELGAKCLLIKNPVAFVAPWRSLRETLYFSLYSLCVLLSFSLRAWREMPSVFSWNLELGTWNLELGTWN
jgi:hypothetical protein